MSNERDNLDKLIRKRGSIKSKLTIFRKFIHELEIAYPDKIITDVNILYDLEQRLDISRTYIDLFDDIQIDIEQLDNAGSQLSEREDFETNFFSCTARAKAILMASSPPATDGPGAIINNSSASSVSSLIKTNNVKLPVIDLPKFDGDANQWLGFRDTFHSLIHTREDISDIQKFHYLKSAVGSRLSETFENLEYSSANYQDAWKSLCERFNDENLLIETHIKALYNLDKITHESSTALRKIIDVVTNRLKALNNLGEPVEHWGSLIKFLVIVKLHERTIDKWDEAKVAFKRPTLENLLDFLKIRANNLQSKENNRESSGLTNKQRVKAEVKPNKLKSFVTSSNSTNTLCKFCKGEHNIFDCSEFTKLGVNSRIEQVKRKGLCINCLRSGHLIKECRSVSCRVCKHRHHTLLHIDRGNSKQEQEVRVENIRSSAENVALTSHDTSNINQVLLSTILIRVVDCHNKPHLVRGLLDVGSQTSFITADLSDLLQLNRTSTSLTVAGINRAYSEVRQRCIVSVHSLTSEFVITLNCLIVPKITSALPNFRINRNNLEIPQNIKLADPNFHIPDKIDILIGSDCFYEILCTGQLKLSKNGPILQKTKFGWVVGGPIQSEAAQVTHCNLAKYESLEKQVTRFWEIEEFPESKPWSNEEKIVETHFLEHTKRDENGKFIVTIPLKASLNNLGNSIETAKKRFLNLERKFDKNRDFKRIYQNFIDEYKNLGHMTKINNPNLALYTYYMPHHGVWKETSISTKLRVVFDSSCTSSSGYSFNDLQRVGPTIQSDLFSILILFRKHNYVIGGDIEKMYRMCFVTPEQRPLQRILWRDNPNEPLHIYELNTITYGTSAAAFLAIRCLYQLGLDCDDSTISDVIKTQFYVDDMLTGASTIEETTRIANGVTNVLQSGGFRLCKFISNSAEVLRNLKSRNETNLMDLGVNEDARTLGMIWNSNVDCFLYHINSDFHRQITKRVVLSDSSQIFDPLGLLSPSIILAKILLRDIWLEKIDWDDSLPLNLNTRWLEFRNELNYLNNLRICRQIVIRDPVLIELHAFSDASMQAYGACIYLKSTNKIGKSFVRLACAKSKVCPTKIQTIPRLELVAAVLMCKLANKVYSSLKLKFDRIVFWTDSSIVLGWINTSQNLLQVFVANRVSLIQELSYIESWRHVPTKDNPADFVSRGVQPSLLESTEVYWNSPSWLHYEENKWPLYVQCKEPLPELKKVVLANKSTIEKIIFFENYSSLSKLERVIAFCLRFSKNCLLKAKNRILAPLTRKEIDKSCIVLARMAQADSFETEISLLNEGKQINKQSKIAKLNPFLDHEKILRVGGRISYSSFPYNKRFPILLCSKSHFARLLFSREHKALLHAGPSLLLAHTRNKFWTLSGRNLARKTVRNCVTCFKARPVTTIPIMGNLPISRLNPAPPFYTTGVDYAGPFKVKDRQGRGCKISKAYICLFVCFATRALHIELVSDLTTEGFIASFRRFVSRRGKPSQVFSDNGTNFVGANNELKTLGHFLHNNSRHLTEILENEGVSWSFIPPHSPHFGGLWEAGIKSAKSHLLRVAGNAILTFEQLYTLLVQIEGILNSRPMHPLSSDPSDLQPLTPSHFLIGRAMTTLPDPDLLEITENRLKLYQRIQQLQQHFWARWSLEYISELQQRTKWRFTQGSLQQNDLVLIKEDNLPPCRWSLGRVLQIHPGKDGVTRVATLKTNSGSVKRSVTKLCRLPLGVED